MTAVEFSIIDRIQKDDEQKANESILDMHIQTYEKQLRQIKAQEAKLQEEYENVHRNLEKVTFDNSVLVGQLKHTEVDTINGADNSGSFFIQLRRVEAELERWETSKEGLTSIVRSLQGDVSNISAKNLRLRKQVDELKQQYDSAEVYMNEKNAELQTANENLAEETSTSGNLKAVVESLKEKIRNFAHGLKDIDPKDTAMLLAQSRFLQNEIAAKTKRLQNLKSEEKTLNSVIYNKQVRRTNVMKSKASTNNWFSERSTLIARVKKLRKDIKMLDTTERGIIRTTERNQSQFDSLNYTSDEVKLAILSEIHSFPTEMPEFIQDAIEVEESYSTKLEKKMEAIEESFQLINNFKENTTQIMKLDEEIAENVARKELLLSELHALRKLIFQEA